MTDTADTPRIGGERVAVLHDGAIHPGGAVSVAIQATRALDADLIVGFSGVDAAWWETRVPNDVDVLTSRSRKSFLQDIRVAWKLRNLNLDDYEIIVTSGPAAKFYQPTDTQRVYHYLHHPPQSVLWGDTGLRAYLVKTTDRIETWSIAHLIANSELTADRIRTHYNRTADAVIHPPVDVDRFSTAAEKRPGEVVMVGRLEERKRPGVAVDAFERLWRGGPDSPTLHFLGDGPLRSTLERRASPNVTFHGYVDDEELVRRVERAAAGLFLSRREDFGVAPIEYMAAGTPVVGVDEPNTNNQVVEGETGILIEPRPGSVAEGVTQVLSMEWDRADLGRRVNSYGNERFQSALRSTVIR